MAFQLDRDKLLKWGTAIGIGGVIAAVVISAVKIAQNKAEYQDRVIVGGAVITSFVAGSAVLAARSLTSTDLNYEADDDTQHPEAEMSYINRQWAMTYRGLARYRIGDTYASSSTDLLAEYPPRLGCVAKMIR